MKIIWGNGIEYRIEYKNCYRGISSRIGMPAVIFYNGTNDWWFCLKRHRVNGEVREIKSDEYSDSNYKLGYYLYSRQVNINIGRLVI